jgi:hypothetical protein
VAGSVVGKMIRVRQGRVLAIEEHRDGVQTLRVDTPEGACTAISFPHLVGSAAPGDVVALNTTAVALGLGTGGQHFVMAIFGSSNDVSGPGHIMKVRYTPSQLRVLAVEEEESPYHEDLASPCELNGMPVAVATLHSLVAPFAVAFKSRAPASRLAYIMTDGAALPAALSYLLHQLRSGGWVDTVITCGHAFGGDLEAVTVYSALHAARSVASCQACIVAMGPGVVGTNTPLGTTALEQAPILDGAGALGAATLAVPRLSFADSRPRHRGLSHHTATALARLAHRTTTLVLPVLPPEETALVLEQCREKQVIPRHRLLWEQVPDIAGTLQAAGVAVKSMGRTPQEDPAFFAAAAAAGQVAARHCCPEG